MNVLDVKTLSCVMLILGLAVCQNGDLDMLTSGSGFGSGDGEEETVTKAPSMTVSTKKAFTVKRDATTDEAGSGDDGEDRVVDVTTKPSTTKFVEPDDTEVEEDSGSGSGDFEFTTKSPATEYIKETKPTKGRKPSTREKVPITAAATTIGNEILVEVTTEPHATTMKPKKTQGPNESEAEAMTDDIGIEVIHSPTTASPEKKATTTMSNEISGVFRDVLNRVNIAAQKGKKHEVKGSKKGLSFTTGIIIGVVVGAVLALLIILFLVYRLRKKDEGSYSLEEPITGYTKQEPGSPTSGKEYFA